MLYVKCKNPDCGGEINAPFAVRVQAAFSRVVNAQITCPFCRTTTTYSRADLHDHRPVVGPMPVRAGASSPSPASPGGGPGLR